MVSIALCRNLPPSLGWFGMIGIGTRNSGLLVISDCLGVKGGFPTAVLSRIYECSFPDVISFSLFCLVVSWIDQ